jgi:hypothetical protein
MAFKIDLRNKEEIRIDNLQQERIKLLEQLNQEGFYSDPKMRTADVERLKFVKRELNQHYIRKNGL